MTNRLAMVTFNLIDTTVATPPTSRLEDGVEFQRLSETVPVAQRLPLGTVSDKGGVFHGIDPWSQSAARLRYNSLGRSESVCAQPRAALQAPTGQSLWPADAGSSGRSMPRGKHLFLVGPKGRGMN